MTVYTTVDSPVGALLLVGEERAGGAVLTGVSMPERPETAVRPDWRSDPEALADAVRRLRAYFAGRPEPAEAVEYATAGTPFQERVWAALDTIPYGTTITYGQLAERVGADRSRVRAVAAAVAANPLLVLRPCHRVIGADGSLTGYAGGVPRKHALLTHEGALPAMLG